jgi:hypothetical protein
MYLILLEKIAEIANEIEPNRRIKNKTKSMKRKIREEYNKLIAFSLT